MHSHRNLARILQLTLLAGPGWAQSPPPIGLLEDYRWATRHPNPSDVELSQVAVRWPRLADAGEDPDWVALTVPGPAQGGFQPMVVAGEAGLIPSQHFLDMADTLALMNQLAYARGKDYAHGHELTYGRTLSPWSLTNISGIRGYGSGDPNAGFVAHNPEQHAICVVLHGSINESDWLTNLQSVAVTIAEATGPGGARMAIPGNAHAGFLAKALSVQEPILTTINRLLQAMSAEDRRRTRFYVSGHSQAAALGQLLVAQLCLRLERWYGPNFVNSQDNRVFAWLLAAPLTLSAEAAAFVETTVGKSNIVVQNTWADPVPWLGLTPKGLEFQPIGTPILQDSKEASCKADRAHRAGLRTHARNGDFTSALMGLMVNPYHLAKGTVAAMHMGTDNVNYRGVGYNFAFDRKMVVTDEAGLRNGLQEAFNNQQEQLRRWARAAAPANAIQEPGSDSADVAPAPADPPADPESAAGT